MPQFYRTGWNVPYKKKVRKVSPHTESVIVRCITRPSDRIKKVKNCRSPGCLAIRQPQWDGYCIRHYQPLVIISGE